MSRKEEKVSNLISKLQIQPGSKGFILDKPRGLDLGVSSTPGGSAFGIVFVRNCEDINRTAAEATSRIEEDGVLWFCYPKKISGVESDINRDRGWEVLTTLGYRGVRQISIDAVWSALRFREKRLVGTKRDPSRTVN